jgi:hypothetical protein
VEVVVEPDDHGRPVFDLHSETVLADDLIGPRRIAKPNRFTHVDGGRSDLESGSAGDSSATCDDSATSAGRALTAAF